MKQLEVFNKIGGIIKELNEQYNYIEANPGDLNELELELFVANAHFLADHAEILIKLNQKNKTAKIAEPKELPVKEKFFEPVVRQTKPEVKNDIKLADTENMPVPSSDSPKDSYSFIMEEIIRHELVVDNDTNEEEGIEEPVQEEIIVEDELKEEKPAEEEVMEEKIAEEPIAIEEPVAEIEEQNIPAEEMTKNVTEEKPAVKEDEVLTINQKISSQLGGKNNIAEHVSAQPVTNLKQAITLNDKMLYVKDLFNGYSLAYSEAIEILNRFNTFEEADRFLNKNYVAKNNWESKPDTTDRFYSLLKRRYS